ncbi:MAG: MFS transporter [Bacillota bacterium]
MSNRMAGSELPGTVARRNYYLLILDGIFFYIGQAFWEPTSVVPAFVAAVTGSELMVGLVSTVRYGLWLGPQLLVAHYVERLPYKKGVALAAVAVNRLAILLIAVSTYVLWPNTQLLTVVFFALYIIVWLGEGITSVPWTDILGRATDPRRRGALIGTMQCIGGLGAFASGMIVARILSSDALVFPNNYALLFLIAAIITSFCAVAFFFVVEPPSRALKRREPMMTYVRSVPGLLTGNALYRDAVITRVMGASIFLSMPFYAVHARNLGVSAAYLGAFVSAQMLGSTVGGPILGRISDTKGNRLVILITLSCTMLAPVLCLLATFIGGPLRVVLFLFVFACLGIFGSGSWMGFVNYIIDCTPEDRRPTYLGAVNTIIAPTTLLPVVGGVIVRRFGYVSLFAITAALLFAAVLWGRRLKEPRHIERGIPI